MKRLRSIRWRLQLWYGALLAAILIGFGLTAYHLERTRQLRAVDEQLQKRLPALSDSFKRSRPRDDPSPLRREFALSPQDATLFDREGEGSFYYVVWLRNGEPVTYSATAPRDTPLPKAQEAPVRARGTVREAFIFPAPGDCLLVGRSIVADLAGLRQFAWWLVLVGAAVLVLGLAGGAWLVARALRPIREISSTAQKIATGDLSQRINATGTDCELGQLADILNSTFARLDAAFSQQARFTADAAHELRTPVTVMLTHTQNGLTSECSNEEHREAFEACGRSAQRMRRLIESLLELARFDAGQHRLKRECVDLGRLTNDCIDLVRPLAEQRRITIHNDLAATECPGDMERLSQVISNVLSNAILHNRSGGEVRVNAGRDNGFVLLTVADTGPGISPNDVPRIFERFYRADKSRAGATGGSGLGLAISKAIVEAHGGTINVETQPNVGTKFSIRLPAE
jgi:two-component system, OmpR family, sensor kinase